MKNCNTTEADRIQGPSSAALAASMQQAEAFTVQELQKPCAQISARLLKITETQRFVQPEPGDETAVKVCKFLDP